MVSADMMHGLDEDKYRAQNKYAGQPLPRVRKPSGCRCGVHGQHHAGKRTTGKFRKLKKYRRGRYGME